MRTLTRRRLRSVRTSKAIAHLAFAVLAAASVASVRADEPTSIPADAALKRLKEGNQRFVADRSRNGVGQSKRVAELAKGQHPFAIAVCCADSRLSPEIILDQGLGDIFVVRSAGHVVDRACMGSIEYALEHFGPSLILVLGHERCGAVKAALLHEQAPGHIRDVVDAIRPAVEATKGQPGDPLDNAVRANVRRVVKQLSDAGPIIKDRIKAGKLNVVGGYYDLESGKIELVKQ